MSNLEYFEEGQSERILANPRWYDLRYDSLRCRFHWRKEAGDPDSDDLKSYVELYLMPDWLSLSEIIDVYNEDLDMFDLTRCFGSSDLRGLARFAVDPHDLPIKEYDMSNEIGAVEYAIHCYLSGFCSDFMNRYVFLKIEES